MNIDIYNLVTIEKIFLIVGALLFIQVIGVIASRIFGLRDGAVIAGFISGIISSTAVTATLAKQSHKTQDSKFVFLLLSFFSAMLAMMLEILFLLFIGAGQFPISLLLLFVGPIGLNIFFIVSNMKNIKDSNYTVELEQTLKLSSTIKLALFIILALVISKILSQYFGTNGLFLFSFFLSLFEVHGSVVANAQLYQGGAFSDFTLGTLVFVSMAASYFSKMFIVWTLGSETLKLKTFWPIMTMMFSLILCWLCFLIVIKVT
jgi:uncharacterized membrane protein (DUF4010 family)